MVPIHKDLIPFFRARVKYPKLACTKRGDIFTSYNQFRNMYSDLMKKLDMNHTIHETRHTCATLLDSADANVMATKRILGHAGDNITRAVYIHKQLADLLKAIDLVKGKDI
jgi:integrase